MAALSTALKSRSRRYRFGDVKMGAAPTAQGRGLINDCASRLFPSSLQRGTPLERTRTAAYLWQTAVSMEKRSQGFDRSRLTCGPRRGENRRGGGAELSPWACQ